MSFSNNVLHHGVSKEYHTSTCVDSLTKTQKCLNQDGRSPIQYSNPRSPEYMSGGQETQPGRSVDGT
jgi:hypothetical protein